MATEKLSVDTYCARHGMKLVPVDQSPMSDGDVAAIVSTYLSTRDLVLVAAKDWAEYVLSKAIPWNTNPAHVQHSPPKPDLEAAVIDRAFSVMGRKATHDP